MRLGNKGHDMTCINTLYSPQPCPLTLTQALTLPSQDRCPRPPTDSLAQSVHPAQPSSANRLRCSAMTSDSGLALDKDREESTEYLSTELSDSDSISFPKRVIGPDSTQDRALVAAIVVRLAVSNMDYGIYAYICSGYGTTERRKKDKIIK